MSFLMSFMGKLPLALLVGMLGHPLGAQFKALTAALVGVGMVMKDGLLLMACVFFVLYSVIPNSTTMYTGCFKCIRAWILCCVHRLQSSAALVS